MKAYTKTVLRCLRANISRFIAVCAVIFLGIAFVSGLGTLSPSILASFSDNMINGNAADVIIKSSSPQGFTPQQLESIRRCDETAAVQPLTAIDMQIGEANARVYIQPLGRETVNRLSLTDGRMPLSGDEVVAERASDTVAALSVGDKVIIFGSEKTVVGIGANPLMFAKEGDADLINSQPLSLIVYLDSNLISLPLPVTDVYVSATGTKGLNRFGKEYDKAVENCTLSLQEIDSSFTLLTLKQNKSSAMLSGYADKIDVICAIFPLFFIALTALVVLTTMSRLIEEERSVIGCYCSLGVSQPKITLKYMLYTLVCCLVSAAAGLVAGVNILPRVIYPAFTVMFFPPALSAYVTLLPGLLAAAAMLAAACLVTYTVCRKEMRGRVADILKPKAPKAGKKIFLEKIPFIWKPLPFRFKSTFRNIFRYVNHFVMTLLSVAGSTALVFAGFALLNLSSGPEDSFGLISCVIIVFALLLSAFVLYNLTNMNIGKRKREIATLKVLGYYENEVGGYIYREVFIMALMGILLGIPLGYALIYFVLTYLDFGSMADIKWYSPLLSAALMILFIGVVDLLLAKKIRSIDMTSSLKSVE